MVFTRKHLVTIPKTNKSTPAHHTEKKSPKITPVQVIHRFLKHGNDLVEDQWLRIDASQAFFVINGGDISPLF